MVWPRADSLRSGEFLERFAPMKSLFRTTSAEDLDALRQFLAQAFKVGLDAPFLEPATMAWKYWDTRDDWAGPRSYVLERNGAIVAHAGIWPMTFETGAECVRGIQMIDWAAARSSSGVGLALTQRLADMFDFIYSIGGSEITCKVLPASGFVEHTRVWHGVRPLRPMRQMLTHQRQDWKLAPRLVRNSWWAMSNGWSPRNWKAKEIRPQEILRELYLSAAGKASFSPRPPAFFEYLSRCPADRKSVV